MKGVRKALRDAGLRNKKAVEADPVKARQVIFRIAKREGVNPNAIRKALGLR